MHTYDIANLDDYPFNGLAITQVPKFYVGSRIRISLIRSTRIRHLYSADLLPSLDGRALLGRARRRAPPVLAPPCCTLSSQAGHFALLLAGRGRRLASPRASPPREWTPPCSSSSSAPTASLARLLRRLCLALHRRHTALFENSCYQYVGTRLLFLNFFNLKYDVGSL